MDRRLSVDLLKILLAVMVVGIHANPVKPLGHDAVLLTGQGLYRLSVPTFFVINGYFLHPVTLAGGTGRYVRRLLWLWVLWTALYLPGWWGLFDSPVWGQAVQTMLIGWWHLWYLPALAMAAAMAALVRGWTLRAQLALMAVTFGLGLGLVYGSALGIVVRPAWFVADSAAMWRNGVLMGFPFLMAGWLIRQTDFGTGWSTGTVATLAGVGILGVLIETLALDRLFPRGVSHDMMLSLALACPALLLLALRFARQSRNRNLGTYANGIYFLHVAFVILCIRTTDLPRPPIYAIAVFGSVLAIWGLIRTGLARRLL
ncbi:acyltransferase family protein [Fuscibacter oryzae]|uniref:Acyltransferase family protein n=1 Tax=Fuscibacter oryzae TaxID=2803939 RepID=A0A8J7MVD8_9RHOB|nr:acyltransferase family protein [Fuscibacter oryzae]MBL4929213.1 acyltransferase family protein [Fuscibacter oryzae]